MDQSIIRTLDAGEPGRFVYRELGEGHPILLLHGWPTSSFLWRNVMPHLARAGMRAIALDLPGFGRTPAEKEASLSFRYYERALEAFLDGLDRLGKGRAGQVDLVVHDAGGPIGLYWASQHPVRVRRITLLNTLIYPEISPAAKAFLIATRVPVVREVLSSRWGIRRALEFGVHRRRLAKEILDEYAAPFGDAAARKMLLRAGLRLVPEGMATLSRWLESTSIPTAAIYGERDLILPDIAKTIARLERARPDLKVTKLPDCAHFIQEERPDEIGAALAAFHGRG